MKRADNVITVKIMPKITREELQQIRHMVYGSQIRVSQMALSLHNEQARIDDMVRILDTYLIEKEE